MTRRTTNPGLPRRRFLQMAGGTVAGAAAASTGLLRVPAMAQSAPTIPSTTVRLACNPYGNHAWVVLAGQQGYLADVGITLDPPEPKVVLEQQSVPQLENDEIDMSTMYVGLITAAIDKLPNIKPFFVYSYWAGNVILAAPDAGIKTVDEFIAEGMSWEDASNATMAQLKGKEIAVPPNPSTYPWMNLAYSFAGLKMEDSVVVALEDPKAVQLAVSGGIQLAAPGGAVQIYQLQHQAGWVPVMSTGQMVEFVTGGPGSSINNVLNYDLVITTQRYIDENRDTAKRMCSALYRTLDYMFGPNQMEALAKYAPFINANAGSDLDADAIKFIFEVLDPFFLWKDQPKIWTDATYSLYYQNIYQYQLAEYIKAGTIADQEYDLDNFFQAKSIWEEMAAEQAKADQLMQQIQSGGGLSPDRQALADTAKKHYDGYNFMDAVRLLEAALA